MANDSDDLGSMETLTAAVERLRAQGYDEDWFAEDGNLRCHTHGDRFDPAEVEVDHVLRFEGPSDPGDEQILYALTAPDGHRGLYSPAYGTYASTDDLAVVRTLTSRP